jgi:membrane-bound serine protease (ClpP class)
VKTAVLRAFCVSLVSAGAFVLGIAPAGGAAEKPRVRALEVVNDVNPVTQAYLTDAIERANRDRYDAVVILLDTPGGLSESMRKIVQSELASRIPVIVYVSPDGARAASAGVWITEAADIAAMAPQTNIGSSTPISVGGEDIGKDLRNKAVNDAAASLRALARTHGRNVAWADAAVRRASNLGAHEALGRNVIDVIAPTLPALLRKVDGTRTVPKRFLLRTAGAQVTRVEMSLWKRILDTLIDPNLIALFLSLGVLGITIELWHPGLVFPAALGGISLITGLYGLSVLPVSWAGLLLMVLAAGFFAAEPFVTSHGALAVAGAASFVVGALMLFDPAGDAYQVSLPVALGIAGAFALFFAIVVTKVARLRRRPAAVGSAVLVGELGEVRRDGFVFVNGELWRARSADGEPLAAGEQVAVEGVEDDLVLDVRRLS